MFYLDLLNFGVKGGPKSHILEKYDDISYTILMQGKYSKQYIFEHHACRILPSNQNLGKLLRVRKIHLG
jgi:hypothetical protein